MTKLILLLLISLPAYAVDSKCVIDIAQHLEQQDREDGIARSTITYLEDAKEICSEKEKGE